MSTEAPFEIQTELRKYKSRTTGTCPECGYVGLMGKVFAPMTKKRRFLSAAINSLATLVVVILFINRIISANIFFGLIIAEFIISTIIQVFTTRNYKLICPACKKETV